MPFTCTVFNKRESNQIAMVWLQYYFMITLFVSPESVIMMYILASCHDIG